MLCSFALAVAHLLRVHFILPVCLLRGGAQNHSILLAVKNNVDQIISHVAQMTLLAHVH